MGESVPHSALESQLNHQGGCQTSWEYRGKSSQALRGVDSRKTSKFTKIPPRKRLKISRCRSCLSKKTVGLRNRIEKPRVYPPRSRFWHAVDGVRLLTAHPDLDNGGVILHKQTYCFPSQLPHAREVPNSIVFLEREGFSRGATV